MGNYHCWFRCIVSESICRFQNNLLLRRESIIQHSYCVWSSQKPFRLITENCGRVINTPALYSGDPHSNLSLETGYPDLSFRGFPWSVQANAMKVSKSRPRLLSTMSFPIYRSPDTLSFDTISSKSLKCVSK